MGQSQSVLLVKARMGELPLLRALETKSNASGTGACWAVNGLFSAEANSTGQYWMVGILTTATTAILLRVDRGRSTFRLSGRRLFLDTSFGDEIHTVFNLILRTILNGDQMEIILDQRLRRCVSRDFNDDSARSNQGFGYGPRFPSMHRR